MLWEVQEQYNLVMSQLTRVPPETSIYNEAIYYEYKELISKNNQHRFRDIDTRNKVVKVFALPGNDHCTVKLLDRYLPLLPPDAPYLYMRAKDTFSMVSSVSSYTNQRVGFISLKNILSGLSKKFAKSVWYINHSLWTTTITRMFQAQVEEKVIAETSSHKSLKVLRCYEHTSQQQQQNVSKYN